MVFDFKKMKRGGNCGGCVWGRLFSNNSLQLNKCGNYLLCAGQAAKGTQKWVHSDEHCHVPKPG